MKKIVIVSGGFDPVHSGHIKLIKEARLLGDMLIVGINSDHWLTKKKGQPFMPVWERHEIINNLKMVDQTLFYLMIHLVCGHCVVAFLYLEQSNQLISTLKKNIHL